MAAPTGLAHILSCDAAERSAILKQLRTAILRPEPPGSRKAVPLALARGFLRMRELLPGSMRGTIQPRVRIDRAVRGNALARTLESAVASAEATSTGGALR